MYMCICSYLPILNTLTRIFIPIPPSLNTNSIIFVACHFPRKFWFQDHILCSNFLIPMYLSCPSLLKYRPLSHSNQRDNPLFLHANFSQIDITFLQYFKQSIYLHVGTDDMYSCNASYFETVLYNYICDIFLISLNIPPTSSKFFDIPVALWSFQQN